MKRSFKRNRKVNDVKGLDGIVTFYSSHHALHAEEVLMSNKIKASLVPGPREISPNCGVALRFEYRELQDVARLFNTHGIKYEEIHYYPVE